MEDNLQHWQQQILAFLSEPTYLLLMALVATAIAFIVWQAKKPKAKLPELPKPLPPELATEVIKEVAKEATQEIAKAEGATQEISPELPPVVVKPTLPTVTPTEIQAPQKSWFERLDSGLARTRGMFREKIASVFYGQETLNASTLETLHEALFKADIGVKTVDKLIDSVSSSRKPADVGIETFAKQIIYDKSLEFLAPSVSPSELSAAKPLVILVVGVNGVGKTTSIGKLAAYFKSLNKSVMLCAADTFRAAAIEQLQVWGERLDLKVIAHQQGSDPAAVAYDAVKAAIARETDVLLIDTAGRLHNKQELMKELEKIKRIVAKDLPGAPQETWLILDSTTGQNAFQQVAAFKSVVDLSGLVFTKLDGTAKGGVLIGISDEFKLPIRYIGVGEQAEDLRPFVPKDYLDKIFC